MGCGECRTVHPRRKASLRNRVGRYSLVSGQRNIPCADMFRRCMDLRARRFAFCGLDFLRNGCRRFLCFVGRGIRGCFVRSVERRLDGGGKAKGRGVAYRGIRHHRKKCRHGCREDREFPAGRRQACAFCGDIFERCGEDRQVRVVRRRRESGRVVQDVIGRSLRQGTGRFVGNGGVFQGECRAS